MDESQSCDKNGSVLNTKTGRCEQPKFIGRSYETDNPELIRENIEQLKSRIKAYNIQGNAETVGVVTVINDTRTRSWSLAKYKNKLFTLESGGVGMAWTDIYKGQELYDGKKKLYPPKLRGKS